jgi:predicted nucleic acid-binding protein
VILIDTSVWVDHLRAGDDAVVGLLGAGRVLAHPFVIGELALGNLRHRQAVLTSLQDLPQATVATEQEVMRFIDQQSLAGLGIGYIDTHLLASTQLTNSASLWSRDKRLLRVAEQLGLAAKQSLI